jgi:V/A-type H+-transporting ATPase subunit E
MGCKELIASLKAAGDERLKSLRAEAEQEAAKVRAESARRIDALRDEHARKHAVEAERQADALLAGANAAVRAIGLKAERGLAERLYGAAQSSLHTLRNEGYPGVFAGFARELPGLAWRTVQVNPADAALARGQFPDAEVQVDPGIAGGLVVETEDGRVRVVNTFEKRLERLWEEMLPAIMKDAAVNK